MLNIKNTSDPSVKPNIVMMVYGEGGIGKSTFASTAPNPIMLDCENGAKYFGLRGISMDVLQIKTWGDVIEFRKALQTNSKDLEKYQTIIIDPIGEAMDKLKTAVMASGVDKWIQKKDGSLSMAGWGELKQRMKDFIKLLRDSGKNVILIGHVDEKEDEGVIVKRPMIETKIATDLRNLVDIVGYMYSRVTENGEVRAIALEDSAKYWAKDRTGTLGKFIKPDFNLIVEKLQNYSWAKKEEVKEDPQEDQPELPPEEPKKKITKASLNTIAKEI